jgi:hypothetical protein
MWVGPATAKSGSKIWVKLQNLTPAERPAPIADKYCKNPLDHSG